VPLVTVVLATGKAALHQLRQAPSRVGHGTGTADDA
jgi:hypothetical protein